MKIRKKYLIFFILLFLKSGYLGAHPYYVSICQIEYNAETKALEIALKTFADDLQKGLEGAGYEDLYLGEEHENPKIDTYILNYLKMKLSFIVNGTQAGYDFVGKEIEEGVVWSYLEIANVGTLESIGVHCSLLTDVFETQNNIVQVEKNKEIKSLLLNKRKVNGEIKF